MGVAKCHTSRLRYLQHQLYKTRDYSFYHLCIALIVGNPDYVIMQWPEGRSNTKSTRVFFERVTIAR